MAKFRPLLAATYEEGVAINFPVIGSPKIDGIRGLTPAKHCGIHDTSSRTLKAIPNTYIRYKTREFEFLDGEFVVGDPQDPATWDRTKSQVMTREGEPDFTFYAFDTTFLLDVPFVDRFKMLQRRANDFPPYIRVLEQYVLRSMEELCEFEEYCVEQSWEGAMYRAPGGPYKRGRSTIPESYLVKWKRFEREEATIVGFREQTTNTNEATIDARGYTKRSSHKENKIGLDTLGAFECHDPRWPETFKLGTGVGLTKDVRKKIWDEREKYLGRKVIYEYQVAGSKDAPRIPTWKAFVT